MNTIARNMVICMHENDYTNANEAFDDLEVDPIAVRVRFVQHSDNIKTYYVFCDDSTLVINPGKYIVDQPTSRYAYSNTMPGIRWFNNLTTIGV